MADYYSPTVVDPTIPIGDMTPLERLLLEHVYEIHEDGDRVYLCESQGANDYPELYCEALRRALEVPDARPSRIVGHVRALLATSPKDPAIVPLDRVDASSNMILRTSSTAPRRSIISRSPPPSPARRCDPMALAGP